MPEKTEQGLNPVIVPMDIEKINHKLMKKLDADRYTHTQAVAYTAASMAMNYGLNVEDAFLAGLLHDCAKCIPDEKKIVKCEKHGIEITQVERKAPYLLHSKLGAYYAEHKYGVTNPDILNAITWHTTGHPKMSKLELILFIADYIEPGRTKQKRLKQIRKMAFKDLEECACMILEDTIQYLKSRGKDSIMDSNTIEAYQYYEKIRTKKRKKEAAKA